MKYRVVLEIEVPSAWDGDEPQDWHWHGLINPDGLGGVITPVQLINVEEIEDAT